ncbi:hypothetical protein EQM14_00930 [Caproiciproducens sp. NJN-50]|uniref:hypothetical protein n=1 Tax=Acutalibacteraceae TaxID=3082771 RepID=UPI000FFE2335|nr:MULTISPECIES: hypothetical protein [Acutalibacteraceae]QAT48457.1 hypothetical protein EQM14_00930 [Caproiciproducens sp. NJN-50]
MNYCEWGREYLLEAQRLKDRLRPLRKQLKDAAGEDAVLLLRRTSMLGEMYLELHHTGEHLLERGDRE